MASVQMVFNRHNLGKLWYPFTDEETSYIKEKYKDIPPTDDISSDGLILTRTRTGSLELCTAFYNELNDPESILYQRKTYFLQQNITFTCTLIP